MPLFSSFRIPSRYTIPFLQFADADAGWAFRSIVTRYGFPQSARIAVAIVALGASAHLIYVNQWNLRNVFTEAPFDTSFHWMSGPRQITTLADASPYTPGSPMLRALMEDRSFFTCYESLQLAHGSGAGSAAGVRRQSRRARPRSRFLAERADVLGQRRAPPTRA